MSDNTQPIQRGSDDESGTRPALPELPLMDDESNVKATQAITPQSRTRGLPPAPPQRAVPLRHNPPPPSTGRQNPVRPNMPPQGQPTPYKGSSRRHGKARSRRDSGLYLPIWSLILMLIIVMGLAAGIIMLVISLGGNKAPETAPVVILSTAIPSQRPQSFPVSPATATFPPEVDTLRSPVAPLVLAGPTVVTPFISPTPRPISIGETVIVSDVGADELNVRDSAGVIDTTIIFRAAEGTRFTIVDGPRQSDGLTWWQIQDPFDASRRGWAASNYLLPDTSDSSG